MSSSTIVVSIGAVNQRSLVPQPAGSTGEQFPMLGSEASSSSFQRQTVLYGHVSPGWQVVTPLALDLERDETGTYIYRDDVFAV